jgi:4-hydroxy-3-methylbut-2-enyl diphosphate reductase
LAARPDVACEDVESESSMTEKRVLLAAPRGFCAGVERAVTIVERALARYGAPIYVRRHIVHNLTVVDRLQRLGAVFVQDTNEIPYRSGAIFSAHGVAPSEYAAAASRGLLVIDATCPLVTKVHREAARLAEAGYDIFLIGQPGHDETVGTAGVAPSRTHVVDPSVPVGSISARDTSRVAWLSQTTLSFAETDTTVRQLRARLPKLLDPPSEDICFAAENRQKAVAAIAPECDLVLVVASQHSHNSAMLARVAVQQGAASAFLVDGPDALDVRWLTGPTVGLTAGASATRIVFPPCSSGFRARDTTMSSRSRSPGKASGLPFRVAFATRLRYPLGSVIHNGLDLAWPDPTRRDLGGQRGQRQPAARVGRAADEKHAA